MVWRVGWTPSVLDTLQPQAGFDPLRQLHWLATECEASDLPPSHQRLYPTIELQNERKRLKWRAESNWDHWSNVIMIGHRPLVRVFSCKSSFKCYNKF